MWWARVDWQPDGTPLLLSVTGMLGGWQANIHRGYSNGGNTAYSDGVTGIGAGVIANRRGRHCKPWRRDDWKSQAGFRLEAGGGRESGEGLSCSQGPMRVGESFPRRITAHLLDANERGLI